MELKIEYLPIGELKAYANNAKIHTAEQIEQIKKSIKEFGFNDPVAVWKDNELIEGHGRLIAAKELGLDVIPVIRLDGLTDEQRRAYMLVHNKLTANTGFDFSLLSLELQNIENIDMFDFGFSDFEMNTWDDYIAPEGYDPNVDKEYGEGDTISTVITIICVGEEEEEFMRKFLGEKSETFKKLYKARDIMEKGNESRS